MYAHDGPKSLLRLVAYLLVLSVVMSCLPVYTRSTSLADETQSSTQTNTAQPDIFFDRVKLYADGAEARYKELAWDSHLTLTAKYEGGDENVDVYTWQIYDPLGCSWVAINSADDAQLKVGAALLSGMTDETGVAILNCKITADGALYYSDTIQILLLSGEEEADGPLEAAQSAETGAAARRSRAAASNAVTDDGTAGGELITYTVTVEYMNYITNSEASKPYIATVKPNTTNLTVFPDSPTVAGFTPYIITKGGIKGAPLLTEGEDGAVLAYKYTDENGVLHEIYGVETHKLRLDLSNVTKDETYQIIYMPNEAYYTVSHYVQNIVNDDYVLYYVETKQGYVGQMTDATNLTERHPTDENGTPPLGEGFTALVPFKNQTIAADGTTQINTYYDRLYFLMTYKLDGGRGVEPVYARYGATIHTPDPERTGFTFAGWVKLEMENSTATASSPRPKMENGKYIPLYTDENGVVQMDGTKMIRLTQDANGTYYGPDGKEYKLLTSDKLMKTMPSFHSAMMAVWEQADTEYTVVYWLENADPDQDNDPDNDYDYLISKTINAATGTPIDENYVIDYGLDGTRAFCESITTATGVMQTLNDTLLSDLGGKEFIIVSARTNLYIADEMRPNTNRLQSVEFNATNLSSDVTVWTFEAVPDTDYQYYLHANGKYICKEDNKLSLVDSVDAATALTLRCRKDGAVFLDNINQWNGASSNDGFGVWNSIDDPGNFFYLYKKTEQTTYYLNDEARYYYYEKNDLAVENGNLTVAANGTTTVNIYYKRLKYNLRFFYARSKEETVGTSGTAETVYEVIGGSSYGFCTTEASELNPLLSNIYNFENDAWGKVTALPEFSDEHGFYTAGQHKNTDDGYTYYYFTFQARYGQNIADEWPAGNMANVTRKEANSESKNWPSKTAVFSAWNGEYWLKYSRTQASTTQNYTIKGNYQLMDENLMYDPSFNTYIDASGNLLYPEEEYGPYYLRGTGSRYLDFVAFYENGADVDWSIPNEFHYYLWMKSEDTTSPVTVQALPNGTADFNSLKTKMVFKAGDRIKIGNDYYELYDKVLSADDATDDAAKQTVPGIAGFAPPPSYSGAYPDYDGTSLYYKNSTWDPDIYEGAYSLHFLFEPEPYIITLQSWNHIKHIPNIPYGSMEGANRITGQYANDSKYDYDPGYMYDSMMKNYYPADLPEGAYYFAGWYKTKDYIPGTEADFTKPMPNYNMMLYAKWEPIRFDVEVHQTSDRDQLVYYPLSDEEDAEHGKMQALVVKETVLIHGQEVTVGKEGTGKGYGEYLPEVVPPSGPDKTYTASDGKLLATIPENCSPLDYDNGKGQIRSDWIFVCYAYMKDGVEHAIDVSSFTITEDVQIYAKWTAVNILDYRVEYVMADLEVLVQESADGPKETLWAKRHCLDEKGQPLYENGQLVYEMKDGEPDYQQVDFNAEGKLVFADGVEWIPTAKTVLQNEIKTNHVADPVVGKVNEGANRTFTAKIGLELYEEYRQGWFPVYVNHTALMQYGDLCTCCDTPVLMGSDEAHPLVTTFYYVPMTYVAYTVRYLDKLGNTLYKEKIVEDNIEMVVTEKYVFCSGYVPDAFQKTMVLSAYDEANVITFVYEKSDGTIPYTIQYYYETLGSVWDEPNVNGKNYLLHHELSGSVDPDGPLSVDYLDITGFEYSADVITLYTQQDLSEWTEQENNTRGEKNNITTGKSALELTDLRGHTVKVEAKDGKVVYTSADGHNHDLNNSVFTYEGYQVKAIRNVSGLLVIDGYANPTGSFTLKNEGTKVELGAYGTVIKVYYDLKLYPYYIIHKIDGADGDELGVELNVAKFQSNVSGTAMTDAQLIEAGWAGYTAREDNKSITITITIQDDGSTPHINTITFLYYEKMMEFDYVPRLLKNPGMEGSAAVVADMPENEPNAQINLVRDYIKTATGTADAAHPVIYENAYEFLGWFLDPECTKPVANSGAAMYLGTDYTQEDGVSTLVGQLTGNQGNMTQDQYKLYDTLLPQKKKADYQYISDGKLTTTDLESGVYVGAFNKETGVYEQQEAFYALFAPKLGSLTITRQNLGANFHNEANSFVYTVQGSDGFTMQVTIGPEDFVVNGVVQTSASVVITNLPIGEYTVTQAEDWSWRYKAETYSVTFTGSDLFQTAAFGGEMTKGSWLSGFADTLKNVLGVN